MKYAKFLILFMFLPGCFGARYAKSHNLDSLVEYTKFNVGRLEKNISVLEDNARKQYKFLMNAMRFIHLNEQMAKALKGFSYALRQEHKVFYGEFLKLHAGLTQAQKDLQEALARVTCLENIKTSKRCLQRLNK